MSSRPNVLLIVADQFRGDLLSDSPLADVANLPRLRGLMNEAVTFSRHYSVVSPCGPSRTSLLTGQYAMNHRVVRNQTPLRHDTPNLAKEAQTIGYAPQLFGYTDSAQDPRVLAPDDPRLQCYEELMPGFDETVRMRMETDDSCWREDLAAKGISLPPYPETYRPVGEKISSPARYGAQDSDTAYLTDRFIDEMEVAPQGWFAALTYVRPHPPFVAPEPYNALYDPDDMPAAESTLSSQGDRHWHPFLAPAQDKQPPKSMVVGFPDLQPSISTTAQLRAIYLGLASEVDHHVGRVMDWLKATGRWDNTILIFTSDHGEMLGDFGLWGKATFHDAAFHVPLIIRDPARPRMHGNVVEGMTASIDVAVTLLNRLGALVPHAMDGRNLLPLLDGESQTGGNQSFSEYDFGNPVYPTVWMRQLGLHSRQANLAVLRSGSYRLVQFAGDLPPVLFDMNGDGERRDLSQDVSYMTILLDLTRQMLCHRMRNSEGTFARTMVCEGGVKTGME